MRIHAGERGITQDTAGVNKHGGFDVSLLLVTLLLLLALLCHVALSYVAASLEIVDNVRRWLSTTL